MNIQKPYDFRERLDEVHRRNIRNYQAAKNPGEIEIDSSWRIDDEKETAKGSAALDLQDYLQTSMNLSLSLQSGAKVIKLEETADTGFDWEITPDRILIRGNIRRGVHYLEDLMNFRKAPFLESGKGRRNPLFSPRMVHSGWGMDQYPDSHLNAIAHAGFDTILLFVTGVNKTTCGTLDFNDLIERAASYGLGVYFYSYLDSYKHPDEPDAPEFFDRVYGSVFKACPKAKGLILVGESCGFPSKDPQLLISERYNRKGVNRNAAGFFPCSDYPAWVDAVKSAVRRYQPEADIVFWTYNWGNQPLEPRQKLIEKLSQDISLEVTFEMFQQIKKYPNHTMVSPDYSITFPGPGHYFISEAEIAHRQGLRLYGMTNTAGMTWDCGVVPYIPVPQQWFKRFAAMREAHEKWNLSGIMDSHHYGWFPSPVSECAKWCFWSPAANMDEILRKIAIRDFGEDAADKVIDAWLHWSNAIDSYTPGFDDQAGPLRIGPAYPFLFHPILYPYAHQNLQFPTTPQSIVGARWLHTFYQPEHIADHSNCGRRIPEDIRILTEAIRKWGRGVELMDDALASVPASLRAEAELQAGVGKFFWHTLQTMLHIKRWWLLNKRLEIEYDFNKAHTILDEMVELLQTEKKHVEATIPLVEADSRLGWEPSMDYMADKSHLEWKIRQLDELLTQILPAYRKTIAII